MNVLILHLSDIHISDASDPILARSSYIASALSLIPHHVHAVIMAFTGDIAFSGNKKEYELATKFIVDLGRRIQDLHPKCGINYILTPGNHDCDFSEENDVRDAILETIGTAPGRLNSAGIIKQCLEIQQAFNDFRSGFSTLTPFTQVSDVISRYVVNVNNQCIMFNAYNTAWMSTLHEKQGRLFFPSTTHKEPYPAPSVSVSIFHHPYNWLESSNSREFRRYIESSSDLVLTGHEHVPGQYLKIQRSNNVISDYIEGGVLQDRSNPRQSEFNGILIDTDTHLQQLFTFAWSKDSYSLRTADENWEPLYRNAHRLSNEFIISKHHYEFLTDPGANFTHPYKDNLSLHDIYIPPNLRKVGQVESTQDNIDLPISATRFFNKLDDKNCVLIIGDEQHGKTTFSKILFQELHQNGLVPILLEGGALKDPAKPKLARLYKKTIKQQYHSGVVDRYIQLDPGKKAIIIDDFHNVPLNGAGHARLISTLTSEFASVFLITDDISKLKNLAYSENWRNPLNDFDEYELLEFGHHLRELLIERWLMLGREMSLEDDALVLSTANTKRLVDSLIGKKLLPSTPIFILIILQQIEASSELQTSAGSQGYLYETLITKALQPNTKHIDLDTAYNFLSEFAYKLFSSRRNHLTENEMENLHRSYCEEYQLSLPYERLARMLISSNMLSLNDGNFSFHYKYSYYYFSAYYIRRLIDGKNGSKMLSKLVENIHKEEHANILVFLTYLSKGTSREAIIEVMLAHARKLYAEHEPCDFDAHVKFVESLYDKLPKVVFTDQSIKSRRHKINKELDEQEDVSNSETDSSPEEDETDEIMQINVAFKTLQILGQVLKNYPGSIKGDIKYEIAQECYLLGLRTLRAVTDVLGRHTDYLIDYLKDRLSKNSDLLPAEQEERAKKLLTFFIEAISTGIIKKISNAAGHETLSRTYDDLETKNDSIPFRIINLGVKLDHFVNFPDIELDELLKLCDNKIFPILITRNLVIEHFYLFPTDIKIKQKYCKKLNVELKFIQQLESNFRKALKSSH